MSPPGRAWHTMSRGQKAEFISELARFVEYRRTEITCKVCLEKWVNRTFMPCGHSCVCSGCESKMKECPICRGKIAHVLHIQWPPTRRYRNAIDADQFVLENEQRISGTE